ncbi:mechanosensitive ion channel family protein [Thiomicrorhabdus sp.]|uniref:mechanosensitive ion channel family protein n=1 Tax=Thiomicrorhabdus sp. TaxID=2039724 RepID=UPI002AA9235D|nr:mechanosensitive ion channel family protein [Thiomicrorhabdus sp.]
MERYYFQIALTIALIAGYFFSKWLLVELILKLGRAKQVPEIRIKNVTNYFILILFIVLVLTLMMVWGVDYAGMLVFLSSVLAVIGVALVAQWSILSNITAGVIVFFAFPARIGDTVEIVDGATRIKGTITEINLFQVLLIDEDNQEIAYPNNLVLQRPVIKMVEKSKTDNTESISSWAKRSQSRSK